MGTTQLLGCPICNIFKQFSKLFIILYNLYQAIFAIYSFIIILLGSNLLLESCMTCSFGIYMKEQAT